MSVTTRREFLQWSTCLASMAALWSSIGAQGQVPCEGLRRVDRDGALRFLRRDKPLFTYRYGGVSFKPYVQALYTPNGVQILRDAPPDHLHHHGLMYAIAANDVTYWEESKRGGRQVLERFGKSSTTGLFAHLVWRDPPGRAVLREGRQIRLWCDLENVTMLTWRTALTPVDGLAPVTLTGHHYYGLGMRFVESMDKGGRFKNALDAKGVIVRGDEKNFQAPWCAYQAEADGKPVTVAMFDGAKNPRPATWFTMGDVSSHFAYLSATLNLHNEPMKLGPDGTVVTYGVALWDGHVDRETIQAQFDAWRDASPTEKETGHES